MFQNKFVNVAVLAPFRHLLTYQIPDSFHQEIEVGMRVKVPLGRRHSIGFVWELSPILQDHLEYKPLLEISSDFQLKADQIELIKWISRYYVAPIGEIIRALLPRFWTSPGKKKIKDTPLILEKEHFSSLVLTSEQQSVVDAIELRRSEGFLVHLLHGVTGSGKTEVYLESLSKVVSEGKQGIALVPEIGLTPQSFIRYQKHFGNRVAVYHSEMSDTEKRVVWQQAEKGDLSVVVGTRSALFVPFPNLGMIVVDEEQDSSYKQEERVRYHAREVAIVRGKIEKIPVLLGSATPSVESYFKAKTGKFVSHSLSERFGESELPKIEILSLVPQQKKKSFISPHLLEEIRKTLARKEQVLIFLNRRGFSHFLICKECGEIPSCQNCAITFTFHQKINRLICHYCDTRFQPSEHCLKCLKGGWVPVGFGTERVEEELSQLFPNAKIVRMDRDTTTRKGSHQKILNSLQEREIDILIGTQMIAKGHDYPFVTLVGVLFADTSLHLPDFRASERTFQLLTQVAGRAGRGALAGKVIFQTFSPDHFSILAAANYQMEEFYEKELQSRQNPVYPPFTRLIRLKAVGVNLEKVKSGCQFLADQFADLFRGGKIKGACLGPAPCLVEKIKNRYQWQLLLKVHSQQVLPENFLVSPLERAEKKFSTVRFMVDVDPQQVL